MKKTIFRALFIIFALLLGGCGGGGTTAPGGAASAPAAANVAPAGTTANSVQLLVASPQMNSSGATTTALNAIVLSATGQVVTGRTVVFSTNADPSAFVSGLSNSGVSDANGVVTAQLNLGGNKSNRTITVSATVDGKTATNTVAVVGTSISFSGNSSLAFAASTALTITVKDSAGAAVPGVTVALTSANGNTIALNPASGLTDATGSITATVTATAPVVGASATDVITATAAGTSKTQNLTISSASFGFTTPAAAAQINVNAATPVSVTWTNNGVAVVGQTVTFTASRGTVTPVSVVTAAGGVAATSITSAAAGPAIITATGPLGTPSATLNVNFVAVSAATAVAQANPSTIQPTTGAVGQTNNTSTISAVVRDAALNLVQNARVNFAITADTTAGSLSAATAVTDASGTASVTYRAGAISSAQNGVTISATAVDIGGVPILPAVAPSNVSLTVGGGALFVRLGTDNSVASSGVNYTKTYSALVTDSAGNPAVGQQVRFVLRPNRFFKGQFVWNAAPTSMWLPVYREYCGNEDINFNGIVGAVSAIAAPVATTAAAGNAGMPVPLVQGGSAVGGIAVASNDYNGNARLDPGNVASVNGTATTDANGFALATISYAKSYAYWVEVVLEARAGVVGNDPPANTLLILPGVAADYSTQAVSPPGQLSSFGILAGCNNSN